MIDLFSTGFTFKIDKEGNTEKKTNFGKLLTSIILLLSAFYFGYLFYLFAWKLNPPTIISETIIQEELFTYNFDYSPIHIQIFVEDIEVNIEKYFTLWTMLTDHQSGHEIHLMKKCLEIFPEETKKYSPFDHCVDPKLSHLAANKNDHTQDKDFVVLLGTCDPNLNISGQTLAPGEDPIFDCATSLEISDMLLHHDTLIFLTTVFFELNHNNGELEEKDDIQEIMLDQSLIQHSHMTIKVAESDLDTHPLWQSHDTYDYAYDYKMTQYFYTSEFTEEKFTEQVMKDAILIHQIVLDTNLKKHTISYQKFSEMIAQFLGLFNTLLIIGIIGNMTSEAKILECTMDMYLREYYKSTAQHLLHKKNNKLREQRQIRQAKGKITPQDIDSEKRELLLEKKLPDISTEDDILDISNVKSLYLNNAAKMIRKKEKKRKLKEKKQKAKELKKNKTLQKSLSSKSLGPDIIEEDEEDELNDEDEPKDFDAQKLYLRMFQETQSAIEFRSLYSQILTLKTQMQLILSQEEYAATQYIGRRLCFSKNLTSKNHVEKQDQIENSEKYRRQKIFEFLQKMDNQSEIKTEQQHRIYDCLLQEVKDLYQKHKKQQEMPKTRKNSKQNTEFILKQMDDHGTSPDFVDEIGTNNPIYNNKNQEN